MVFNSAIGDISLHSVCVCQSLLFTLKVCRLLTDVACPDVLNREGFFLSGHSTVITEEIACWVVVSHIPRLTLHIMFCSDHVTSDNSVFSPGFFDGIWGHPCCKLPMQRAHHPRPPHQYPWEISGSMPSCLNSVQQGELVCWPDGNPSECQLPDDLQARHVCTRV